MIAVGLHRHHYGSYVLEPKISDYWKAIFQTVSTILHKHIALDPLMAVLGIIDSTAVKMKSMIWYLLSAYWHED